MQFSKIPQFYFVSGVVPIKGPESRPLAPMMKRTFQTIMHKEGVDDRQPYLVVDVRCGYVGCLCRPWLVACVKDFFEHFFFPFRWPSPMNRQRRRLRKLSIMERDDIVT